MRIPAPPAGLALASALPVWAGPSVVTVTPGWLQTPPPTPTSRLQDANPVIFVPKSSGRMNRAENNSAGCSATPPRGQDTPPRTRWAEPLPPASVSASRGASKRFRQAPHPSEGWGSLSDPGRPEDPQVGTGDRRVGGGRGVSPGNSVRVGWLVET